MATANIEIDARDLEHVQKALILYHQDSIAALNSALNKTISRTVTYIHEEVSKEYAVKPIGVRKTLSIKKSTRSTLTAIADSKGRRLKLSAFPFRSKGKMRIARVKVFNGGFVESNANPPLFVGKANKTTGKRDIFIRTPNGNFKLSFGFSLAIPQMVANDDVYSKIALRTNYYLSERFEHELQERLSKIKMKEGL